MTIWKWCYIILWPCFCMASALWWIWLLQAQSLCTCMISLTFLLNMWDAGARLLIALWHYSVLWEWQQLGSTLASLFSPTLSTLVGFSNQTFSTEWASSLWTSSTSIYAYCSCCMFTGSACSSRPSRSLLWVASCKKRKMNSCLTKKRQLRRIYDLLWRENFHNLLFICYCLLIMITG